MELVARKPGICDQLRLNAAFSTKMTNHSSEIVPVLNVVIT